MWLWSELLLLLWFWCVVRFFVGWEHSDSDYRDRPVLGLKWNCATSKWWLKHPQKKRNFEQQFVVEQTTQLCLVDSSSHTKAQKLSEIMLRFPLWKSWERFQHKNYTICSHSLSLSVFYFNCIFHIDIFQWINLFFCQSSSLCAHPLTALSQLYTT